MAGARNGTPTFLRHSARRERRPGYNARYRAMHGPRRWQLCKTAFPIAVERAAKFARHHGALLRVYVERSDKATENQLRGYYDLLRTSGSPFDTDSSAKYSPLSSACLRETLYEFRVKTKSSSLMQIADLALWPMCVSGYTPTNRAFVTLKENAKLLDAKCTPENQLAGIKYSCFD